MRQSKTERGAQRPSREEIAAFYERYAPRVYRLCMSFMKNTQDAADAMQDTFLRWIEAGNRPRGDTHEIAWLAVTAGNICRDRLRRRKSFPQTDISELADVGRDDDGYRRTELFEAVAALPDKYKTVIFLFYYEDLTTAQISEATGVKPSTVTSLLTRARRLLRKSMNIEGDDLDG